MVQKILQQFSMRVGNLVTWLRGYEETGEIPIDSVAYETRISLREAGVM
jgi:hypothetical protein